MLISIKHKKDDSKLTSSSRYDLCDGTFFFFGKTSITFQTLALQAMASTNDRLSKEKQQDTGDWSANVAALWAAALQTLLTQTKETKFNNTLAEKTSITNNITNTPRWVYNIYIWINLITNHLS